MTHLSVEEQFRMEHKAKQKRNKNGQGGYTVTLFNLFKECDIRNTGLEKIVAVIKDTERMLRHFEDTVFI